MMHTGIELVYVSVIMRVFTPRFGSARVYEILSVIALFHAPIVVDEAPRQRVDGSSFVDYVVRVVALRPLCVKLCVCMFVCTRAFACVCLLYVGMYV